MGGCDYGEISDITEAEIGYYVVSHLNPTRATLDAFRDAALAKARECET